MSKSERIGITDGGGRGAVLAHKYSQSPGVQKIVMMPGNDLAHLNTGDTPFGRYIVDLKQTTAKQTALALSGHSSMIDVCQDDMTAGGAVNALRERNFPVVGPVQEAARLEWDKEWAREFMKENDIPHPAFYTFHSESDGLAFIRSRPDQPWVVKAAGLALGKGVYVTSGSQEAEDAIEAMKNFGSAGKTYLLEERLQGEEFSAFAVSDGEHHKGMGCAQDHKRLLENDMGPNTGGMGCSSSPLIITPDIQAQIDDIFQKTFKGLRKKGHPYTGILYLGGMVVDGKVNVIEFNSRWGDPEVQVILPGLQTDLLEVSRAVIEKRINELQIQFDDKVRVAVALASRGYPDSSTKGKQIFGIDEARSQPGVTIYGAAVKRSGGHDYTNGGRLLYVVGEGADVNEARKVAYNAMNEISVEGGAGQFRTDIGYRDVERLKHS